MFVVHQKTFAQPVSFAIYIPACPHQKDTIWKTWYVKTFSGSGFSLLDRREQKKVLQSRNLLSDHFTASHLGLWLCDVQMSVDLSVTIPTTYRNVHFLHRDVEAIYTERRVMVEVVLRHIVHQCPHKTPCWASFTVSPAAGHVSHEYTRCCFYNRVIVLIWVLRRRWNLKQLYTLRRQQRKNFTAVQHKKSPPVDVHDRKEESKSWMRSKNNVLLLLNFGSFLEREKREVQLGGGGRSRKQNISIFHKLHLLTRSERWLDDIPSHTRRHDGRRCSFNLRRPDSNCQEL